MGRIAIAIALAAAAGGCCACGKSNPHALAATATRPGADGLVAPMTMDALDAVADPPLGWRQETSIVDARHTRVVWISPTGDTAYGIVLIHLPLPEGPDLVLWGFLYEMSTTDQKGELLAKEPAPELPGLRFVANSARYRLRANLSVHGWQAWVVYAGTLISKPVNTPELRMAEQARNHTLVWASADKRLTASQ